MHDRPKTDDSIAPDVGDRVALPIAHHGLIAIGITCAVLASACTSIQRGPNAPAKDERWIDTVELKGNEAFSADQIRDGLVTHEPTGLFIRTRVRYDASLIDTDRRRIETYYKQNGFFEATVVGVETKKLSGLGSKVTFEINEGKPSLVTAIDISGVSRERTQALTAELGIKIGERFSYSNYDRGKEQIKQFFLNQGFAHVILTPRAVIDRNSHRVTLEYKIDRGPLVTIGEIEVRGLELLPESAIRNRLAFATGDRFDATAIESSRAQLRGLGRLGVIRIDFVDDSRSAIGDIVVTVTEGPRREVRLGAGGAFDGGISLDNAQWLVRGRAGYTLRGVIDPLTVFDAELRPGYSFAGTDALNGSFVGEAETSLSRDDLIIPLVKGSAKLGYDIRRFDAFTSRGPGVRLSVERPLWQRRIKVGFSWQVELVCFTDRPAILDPGDDTGEYDADLTARLALDRNCGFLDFPTASSYRHAFFEQLIALDMRDSLLDTRSGYYLEARFEEAVVFSGSEFAYLRVTPEARGYFPASSRITLAARVRYGRTFAGALPITRRYFSGGASSQRGFGQRQLSPVAGDLETSTVEIGGDELLESTAEARVDLFKLWGQIFGIVLFTDAGDVSDDGESIDFGNLHIASGLGFRLRTPIGPFRLDFAYRVTRRGAGEIHASDSFAWHLSVGEAF